MFWLLGGFLGQTLEVDPKTCSKEIISHGRVKISLGRVMQLPIQIPLLVEDLQILVVVERDAEVGEDFQAKTTLAWWRREL